MDSNKGFTLVESLVVMVIISILVAVVVPIMKGHIDSARWSEGRAIMGVIARALRTHIAETGNNFTPVPTLTELGLEPGNLNGTYFSGGESGTNDFSWVINNNVPIEYLITATAPAGIHSPSQVTLNQAGIFMETP